MPLSVGKKAPPHTPQCLNRIQKPRQALHVAWLHGAQQTDHCRGVLFIWKTATNEKSPPPPGVALIKALGDLESNPSLWLGIYGRFIYLSIHHHHHPPFLQEEFWCQWENSLSFSGLQLCFDGAIHPALIPSLPVTASWISSTGRHTFPLRLEGIGTLGISIGICARRGNSSVSPPALAAKTIWMHHLD